MPTPTDNGTAATLETPNATDATLETEASDTTAPVEGESAQHEGGADASKGSPAEGDDGAAAGGAGAEEGADPDADIKAILRGATPGKPLQAKPGTDAAARAGEGATDGKPAGGDKADKGDKAGADKPAEPLPFAQRFEAVNKSMAAALAEHFDPETAKGVSAALTPVLDLVKDQQATIERLEQAAGGYAAESQARAAQTFHAELDRLADNGFKDVVGSTKDDSADFKTRAAIWNEAKLALDAAQRAGRPISEERAVLFAVRMRAEGDKSPAITEQQRAAAKRQGMRTVAPKSAGGTPVKDPDIDPNDPDAEAKAAVRETFRKEGIPLRRR